MPVAEDAIDEALIEGAQAIIRESPLPWLETYGRIVDKDGKLTGMVANPMQRELGAIYDWCQSANVPMRVVGLKARQTGLSTASTAVAYHHMQRRSAKGCIIGDEYEKSVKNLVQMFNRYEENDAFGWGNTYRPASGKFSHGSELVTETANDPRAGASGTLQLLIGTEVAHWPETGVRSAAQVLASILNCVPELPNTCVILESTPNGATGVFYETYQGAVTLDERKAGKAGKVGNGYIRLFYAWFSHPEYEKALTAEEACQVMDGLTQHERGLVERFGLRAGHVAFRRETIAGPKFRGDEKMFDQEYPSDDESCFLSSGRPRFDMEGIGRMRRAALGVEIFDGAIEGPMDRLVFRREPEGWCRVWEKPALGRRYLLAVDPATGASQAGGKNPDCHSALMLRAGYFGADGKYVVPRVVARVFHGCRVELDLLGDFCERLGRYYGGALIVPEANNSGLALIEVLKGRNVSIYEREVFNYRESKRTKALGWQTRDGAGRDGTRSIAVGNLAVAIREGEIDIPCLDTLDECASFVTMDSGRAEAMRGKHDDNVLALAIGLTCVEGATLYRENFLDRVIPRDVAIAMGLERDEVGLAMKW